MLGKMLKAFILFCLGSANSWPGDSALNTPSEGLGILGSPSGERGAGFWVFMGLCF